MVPVEFWSVVGLYFVGAMAVQAVLFALSVRLKRVDIVDAGWGVSFMAGFALVQIVQPKVSWLLIIVSIMLLLWGVRIATHIGRRFLRSTKQDERYTELMDKWPRGHRTAQMFFKIFLVQGLLVTGISLPLSVIYYYTPAMTTVSMIGVAIWMMGYMAEVTADRQLREFIQSGKKGVMQDGLWQYSRHPNYFGEIMMWWGYAVIASATPLWWLGVIGAGIITYLICCVSGIPPAERRTAGRAGWDEYVKRTSVLIPWLPKR